MTISESPEKKCQSHALKHELYISTGIFIVSLFYYLSYQSYGFTEVDWGGIVIAAERILQGDIFYRDFSLGYTPGIYLYTALSFKLFGVSLSSATVAWSILRAFNCVLIYIGGIRFVSRRLALLLPLILWVTAGPIHKSFLIFFELFNLLILLRLLSTDSKGFYFISGIAAGVTLIFKIELFGFFTITVLLIEFLKIIERRKTDGRTQIARSLKNFSFFGGGTVSALAPIALYLFLNSAMADAISQNLNIIKTITTKMLVLPEITQIFSWDKWDFIAYDVLSIPFAIYSLLLAVIFLDIRNRKFTEEHKKLLIIFLYGVLILQQITRTPTIGRLYQISPPILIADMYLVSRYYINRGNKHLEKLRLIYPLTLTAANFALLFLMLVSCFVAHPSDSNSIFIRFTNTALLSAPKVEVYTTYKQADEFNRIRNIIESETKKDEYIFMVQDLSMYYFVTERKNATRYYYIEAYAGSDKKQLEVIKNLADKKVKLIILRVNHPYTTYIPIVVEYMNKHYRIKETIGGKIILIRRNNDAA